MEATMDSGLGVVESEELEAQEFIAKPVHPLLIEFTAKGMVGMLSQAVMVMIEGIIIGNGLGYNGLAIVAVIMPLEYLNLAIGTFFSLGVGVVVGDYMGAGNMSEAKRAFSQGFWYTLYVSLFLGVVLFIFAEPVVDFLGATPDIHDGCVIAARIFVAWYPLEALSTLFATLLRTDNKPGLSSAVMLLMSVVAVAWLYLSVMVLPIDGSIGIGFYYGCSIGLGFIAIFYFLFDKNTELRITRAGMRLDPKLVAEMSKVGLPAFLVQVASVVYSTVINNELAANAGADAEMQLATFSLLNGYIVYTLNIVWMAFSTSVQPIASYNYGARRWERLKELLKWQTIDSVAVCAVLSALFIAFAHLICSVFAGGDAELANMAASYTLPMVVFTGLGAQASLMSNYYQSVLKVGLSTFFGLLRYLILGVPFMLVMSSFMGVNGVWYSNTAADLVAFVISMAFLVHESRQLSAAMKAEE